jgi:ubiquinone/menaquinone biosynthesis C-methylase UbiE
MSWASRNEQPVGWKSRTRIPPKGPTLQPNDRVVELGCGPGGFSRRILRRLGAGGVLVGVDRSEGLLTPVAAVQAGGRQTQGRRHTIQARAGAARLHPAAGLLELRT